MSLNDFIDSRRTAIRANFMVRNSRIFQGARHTQLKAQRRTGIRKMVAQVRLAQCPVTSDAVAHRVSHSVKPAR